LSQFWDISPRRRLIFMVVSSLGEPFFFFWRCFRLFAFGPLPLQPLRKTCFAGVRSIPRFRTLLTSQPFPDRFLPNAPIPSKPFWFLFFVVGRVPEATSPLHHTWLGSLGLGGSYFPLNWGLHASVDPRPSLPSYAVFL